VEFRRFTFKHEWPDFIGLCDRLAIHQVSREVNSSPFEGKLLPEPNSL
jgi:hypothetical protein